MSNEESVGKQPTLRAVRMSLFPEMETLQSAVELANSQLPITNTNAMLGVLYTYHNTLIKQIEREKANKE